MRICKVCEKIVETLTQCLHLIIATLLKNPGHHVQKMHVDHAISFKNL